MNTPLHRSTRHQQGIATLVVLVLMTVMLYGALAFAKMTEIGTLASGNVAFKERAMQASTVGINAAFDAVEALVVVEQNVGNWYFASAKPLSAEGLPVGIDWATAATTPAIGAYEARYVVERLCTQVAVTNPKQQCLLKQADTLQSIVPDGDPLDPPAGEQFRITVRVTGPKNTLTFAQVLTTRGDAS